MGSFRKIGWKQSFYRLSVIQIEEQTSLNDFFYVQNLALQRTFLYFIPEYPFGTGRNKTKSLPSNAEPYSQSEWVGISEYNRYSENFAKYNDFSRITVTPYIMAAWRTFSDFFQHLLF